MVSRSLSRYWSFLDERLLLTAGQGTIVKPMHRTDSVLALAYQQVLSFVGSLSADANVEWVGRTL